jgi:phosphinothricin acetyltransferase
MTLIRYARTDDAAAINEIGNYYIEQSPANFKIEGFTDEERLRWLKQFSETGRHRLLVACEESKILGYACSARYQDRCAYETSISTSIYLHPDARTQGLGTRLYTRLFEALEGEDIKRAFAGITLPNPASVAIHLKFGFTKVGVFTKAGRKFGKYWDVLWLEKDL